MKRTADDLAADIRRIDGNHDMGAGGLADALFAAGWGHIAGQQGDVTGMRDNVIGELEQWFETVGVDLNAAADSVIAAALSCSLATRSPQPSKPARTCSDERPCIPCYSDSGECIGPYRAKPAGAVHIFGVDLASGPDQQVEARLEDGKIVGMAIRDGDAGAVPMPIPVMEILDRREVTPLCDHVVMGYTEAQMIAYGNAREAAAGGVALIDPAELLSAYVSRCIAHRDDAPRDYRIAAMREALEELGAKPALIPQQPTVGCVAAGWRCFHCSEEFTNNDDAALHFGSHEHQQPACLIDIPKHREIEAMHLRYLAEDADIHRQMLGMRSDHQRLLFQAEERGYAKGIEEAAKYSVDSAVEATGTVDSTTLYTSGECLVEIMLDSILPPHWMDGDNVRVTISPTGGKSDA